MISINIYGRRSLDLARLFVKKVRFGNPTISILTIAKWKKNAENPKILHDLKCVKIDMLGFPNLHFCTKRCAKSTELHLSFSKHSKFYSNSKNSWSYDLPKISPIFFHFYPRTRGFWGTNFPNGHLLLYNKCSFAKFIPQNPTFELKNEKKNCDFFLNSCNFFNFWS